MKSNFKSKPYYFKVWGEKALFTSVDSKGGGEKSSYLVPTRQALQGIVDSIYFKPTIKNIVDEVKVINQITTQTMGIRALVKKGTAADLNYYTYLTNVCYCVKYHYEWNDDREDLARDRNEGKHHAIIMRSLERGGRFSIYLGTSECMGYVEKISKEDYYQTSSFYDKQSINFGTMFHSFIYPNTINKNKNLISCFAPILMKDGYISYPKQENCNVRNVLSPYEYKDYRDRIVKSAGDEIIELGIKEV